MNDAYEIKYQQIMEKLSCFESDEIDEKDMEEVENVNKDIIEFASNANNKPEYIKAIFDKINTIVANLNYQKSELSKRITDSTYNKNAYKSYIQRSLVLDGKHRDN